MLLTWLFSVSGIPYLKTQLRFPCLERITCPHLVYLPDWCGCNLQTVVCGALGPKVLTQRVCFLAGHLSSGRRIIRMAESRGCSNEGTEIGHGNLCC